MIMVMPAKAIAIAYFVLPPRLFRMIPAKVVMQSKAVITMVMVELCVIWDSMMVPSPQSKAVPVKAMIQKGHLGSITSINPVSNPNLPFISGLAISLQLWHVVSIEGNHWHMHNKSIANWFNPQLNK
jgi:hypothetical protein